MFWSAALLRRFSAMGRPFKPVHDRRTESLSRDAFRNDQIEAKCVEFAQVTKEVGRGFAQVCMFAQITNSRESLPGDWRVPA
jgi:hypothetical protein